MPEISLTGDQMLVVLEVIARHGPLSATDVAKFCRINRTVAYRLINTLWKRSFIRQTPEGFVVGHAILHLSKYLERDVGRIAREHLNELSRFIGETTVLHCIDRDEAIVAEQALGDRHVVRVQHMPGARHPLTSGAGGWSLLSFQDDSFISRILQKHPVPSDAWQRLAWIREQGYAVSHDELQEGVHALAVPVLDADVRCIASVAVLVPSIRADGLEQLLPQLLGAAERISRAPGVASLPPQDPRHKL